MSVTVLCSSPSSALSTEPLTERRYEPGRCLHLSFYSKIVLPLHACIGNFQSVLINIGEDDGLDSNAAAEGAASPGGSGEVGDAEDLVPSAGGNAYEMYYIKSPPPQHKHSHTHTLPTPRT